MKTHKLVGIKDGRERRVMSGSLEECRTAKKELGLLGRSTLGLWVRNISDGNTSDMAKQLQGELADIFECKELQRGNLITANQLYLRLSSELRSKIDDRWPGGSGKGNGERYSAMSWISQNLKSMEGIEEFYSLSESLVFKDANGENREFGSPCVRWYRIKEFKNEG